jgi:hypothetical protein
MKRLILFAGALLIGLTASLSAQATPLTTSADYTMSAAEEYPTKKEIQGEWKYSELTFENRGGDDLANMVVYALRSQRSTIVDLIGFDTKDVVLKIDAKKTSITQNSQTATCDYTYEPKTGDIEFKGITNGTEWSIKGIVIDKDGALCILFDVRELIELANKVSAELKSNSQFTTMAGMLKDQKGIFIGAKFIK